MDNKLVCITVNFGYNISDLTKVVIVITKAEHIEYWINSAEDDYATARFNLNNNHNLWAIFIAHLAVEKLLKAAYCKNVDFSAPRTHNLVLLAEKSKLELTSKQLDEFELLTKFQISARYPDYKREVNAICTNEFTAEIFKTVEVNFLWLKKLILE